MDGDRLIYEVQCNTCHGSTRTKEVTPRTEAATSFAWGNFDKHICNLMSNKTLGGVRGRSFFFESIYISIALCTTEI